MGILRSVIVLLFILIYANKGDANMGSDKDCIKEHYEFIIGEINKRDVGAWLSAYAEGAKILGPYGVPANVTRASLTDFLKDLDAGDMYKIVSFYEINILSEAVGQTMVFFDLFDSRGKLKGNYKDLLVWKKVHGKWLVFRDYHSYRSEEPK